MANAKPSPDDKCEHGEEPAACVECNPIFKDGGVMGGHGQLTEAELRAMVAEQFGTPIPVVSQADRAYLLGAAVEVGRRTRKYLRSAGGEYPRRRVAPPSRGELRVAAAVLPNPDGPRGPFTKSQRLEVRLVLAAYGRKAGKP
jgi:hypothetical protein